MFQLCVCQTCSQVSEVQVQVKSQVSEVKSKSSLKSLKRSPSQVFEVESKSRLKSLFYLLATVLSASY